MKNLFNFPLITLIIWSTSCSDNNLIPAGKVVTGINQLQEIKEGEKEKYLFTYDLGRLVSHVAIDSPATWTYNYHYDLNTNLLDTIYMTRTTITKSIIVKETFGTRSEYFNIVPVFANNRLIEFTLFKDPISSIRFQLEYDTYGKIVQLLKYFPSGIAEITKFVWEGENVSRFEWTSYQGLENITWVYEFEYDNKLNPFSNVFGEFNFDFISFLPLVKNNCIRSVEYLRGNPDIRSEFTNDFTYSAKGFPFIKISNIKDFNGLRSQVYSTFHYKTFVPAE
jgi:hypothetical protein